MVVAAIVNDVGVFLMVKRVVCDRCRRHLMGDGNIVGCVVLMGDGNVVMKM